MASRKREIYIRLTNIEDTVEILKLIKSQEKELKNLFNQYDRLNLAENKIFENWSSYTEEILQKLDHTTL